MAINIPWSSSTLKQLPASAEGATRSIGKLQISSVGAFEISGIGLLCVVALVAWLAFSIRKNPARAARFAERVFGGISAKFGKAVAHRVQAFGEGLNTVQDLKSFFQLSGLSLLIWLIIGFAYEIGRASCR